MDKVLVSIGSIFTLGLCTVILLASRWGLGQHIWNLQSTTILDDMMQIIQLLFIGNIFGSFAITFTKLSIIATYLRLFPYQVVRIIMFITGAVTIGVCIAAVFTTIFQCVPVKAAWDFTIKDAKCVQFTHYLYATTAINVTTDLILCITPIKYIINLQQPKRQRLVLSFLFFFGGLYVSSSSHDLHLLTHLHSAFVAGIVRLIYLHQIAHTIDYTWNLVPTTLCTMAECTVGICCVSVPPMRPLLNKLSILVPSSVRDSYNRSKFDQSKQTERQNKERQDNYAMGYQPGVDESAGTASTLVGGNDEEKQLGFVGDEQKEEQQLVMPKSWILDDDLTGIVNNQSLASLPGKNSRQNSRQESMRQNSTSVAGRNSSSIVGSPVIGRWDAEDEIWAGPHSSCSVTVTSGTTGGT